MKKLTLVLIGFGLVITLAIAVASSTGAGSGVAQANTLRNFWEKLFPAQPGPAPASPPQAGGSPPATAPSAPLYRPTVDYEEAVVKAVEHSSPAVISIVITKDLDIIENCPFNPFGDLPPEFRQFFDFGPFEFQRPCKKGTKRQEVGGGSGFIVSADGLVLTNKHVVQDTNADYTVITNDGKKYSAKVLARDPALDLAVVKITSTNGKLPTVILGNSDTVKLGQTAIAIGNALGEFRNTVSVGIISGLARNITASGGGQSEFLEGLIQTDAAINPGNSGGPLLNLRGEVIAINTAVAQGAENIGFAIPINKAKRDIESVKATGKISLPYLGVRYILITEDIAKRDKLSVEEGAVVRGNEEGPGVIPDSPAAKAGILSEDIILEIGGEKITPEQSLSSLIQKRRVGERVAVKILREGKELTLTVALGERPNE